MKALFLYNPNAGRHVSTKQINYIKDKFTQRFSNLDIVASQNPDHFSKIAKESCGKYDHLIIAGGDGTVNMTLNAIAKETNRPVLSIVPLGTINDGIKNIGGSSRFKRSIKNILNNEIKTIDIFQANDHYCLYAAACGSFSDLPYVTPNISKKIFGRFAYYIRAIPRFFNHFDVTGDLLYGDTKIHFSCPFILILNGKRMGGFTINKKSTMNDGKVDVFLAKKSIFNAIPKYFFRRSKIPCYNLENFEIKLDKKIPWDFDGEKFPAGNIKINVDKNYLKVLL